MISNSNVYKDNVYKDRVATAEKILNFLRKV